MTLDHIDRLLDRVGALDRGGPHVIVVLDSDERHYDYIDCFRAEDGAYGSSAGTCVTRGYVHIVVGPGDASSRRSTIAHELTHVYLTGHDLPLWLEEGLAQLVQEHAAGERFHLTREDQREHREHWSASGLEPFWCGDAFSMPDESQRLAYQLAHVLVRSIISDRGRRAAEFVREARFGDAGEGAARHVLGHRAGLATGEAPLRVSCADLDGDVTVLLNRAPRSEP
jgi:hypothetical protein